MAKRPVRNSINKYNNLSAQQQEIKDSVLELFNHCPLPDPEKLDHLGMYLGRMQMQRIITLAELYKLILNQQGIIIEFGTRWGYNVALFTMLRGIFEPYVRSRKIVGFDTFEGFLNPGGNDGEKSVKGDFGVTEGYKDYLHRLIKCLEQQSPIAHISKYELVQGDAVKEAARYLKNNPQTIIALVYFDMNLYEPTKKCLEMVRPYMPKGSVVVFDQLNYQDHPGETVAFREVFGVSQKVCRTPISSSISYIVLE